MTDLLTTRDALARWFHGQTCHMPGCDGSPMEHDYEDADSLLASGAVADVAKLAENDALVDAVARSLASLDPGEDWPTNEALGGSLTGTRDDEYRAGMRDEATDALTALAAALAAG